VTPSTRDGAPGAGDDSASEAMLKDVDLNPGARSVTLTRGLCRDAL